MELGPALNKIRALLLFVNTFSREDTAECQSSDDLRDGHVLLQALHVLAPDQFPIDALDHNNSDGNILHWKDAAGNLLQLVSLLENYYNTSLDKKFLKVAVDVDAIARDGDCVEMVPLAELVVGAAVLCPNKDTFIKENILRLDASVQIDLQELVQACLLRCDNAARGGSGMVIDSDRLFRAEEMSRHLIEERERISSENEALQLENSQLKALSEELSGKVGELEDIKDDFEGQGQNSLHAVKMHATQVEVELQELKREMDLVTVENDRLMEACRGNEKKIEQLKEATMSSDISMQLMRDELDVAREKSARLIKAEGNVVTYKRKLEGLSDLKQENKEQLELLQQYSTRISELESKEQEGISLKKLVEQLKSNSVEMELAKFEALSAVELKNHDISRIEAELEESQQSYKRLDSEFNLVRGELESMATAAADADSKSEEQRSAELSTLRSRVQELQYAANAHAAGKASDSTSADLEQQLIFVRAQLETTQQEKASREELLLTAKKQLAAALADRARAQRSLTDAQGAISAVEQKLKASKEAQHRLEQLQASTKMLEEKLKDKETTVLRLESQRRELELFSRNKLESFKNKFMSTLKAVQAEKEVLEASLERLADRADFDRETSRREERLLLSAVYQTGVRILERNMDKQISKKV